MTETTKIKVEMWLTFDEIELIHKVLKDGIMSKTYDYIIDEWRKLKIMDEKFSKRPRKGTTSIDAIIS